VGAWDLGKEMLENGENHDSDIQSHAQKKGECFKDLYIRDLVITGRMKWRGKFHNVETTHFQEE